MHPLSRGPNFAWTCNLFKSHRVLNCAASILHSMVILRAAIGFGLSLSLIQLPVEKENLKGTYFERVHEIITSILSNMFNLWNICFFPLKEFLEQPPPPQMGIGESSELSGKFEVTWYFLIWLRIPYKQKSHGLLERLSGFVVLFFSFNIWPFSLLEVKGRLW